MTADRYTKAVLTVIAVSLLTIAVNGSGYVKPAQAELSWGDELSVTVFGMSDLSSGLSRIASAIDDLDLSCN